MDTSNYALRPSLPFNEDLYFRYWPVSGESESNVVFKNHCSGVKLAPSSVFTHLKAPMLKRRSKDIAQRGMPASDEWLGAQDKPPVEVKAVAFANALNECGNTNAIDAILNQNIVDYAFRPFVTLKAFLWQDLLQKFSHVGGGGTRRRPEISKAFSEEGTVGFALSHSPKDQKDSLKQFTSFCWYYPDNDLCRRGNSFVYLNRYPSGQRGQGDLKSNINDNLCAQISTMLSVFTDFASTEMVFYTFAILCPQVYLDEFEGALFTVNRADMRPRIPIVQDAEVFQLISWSRAIQPFDEENETITLTDGQTRITIPCSLDVQRINISGYEVIKNAWMKFNAYDFTHCAFTAEDMDGLLDLVNKLLEYVSLVGEIDVVMHDIIKDRYSLICPLN